jgi:hypothetical protein
MVTSFYFENEAEKKKTSKLQTELLKTIASSDQPLKYVVMGRNDEYQEIGYKSMRPFGNIIEAVNYGEKLIVDYPYSYQSFIIQPLLKDDTAGFNLSKEQIDMIYDIENSNALFTGHSSII